MNQPILVVRTDTGTNPSSLFSWSAEQAGLPAWNRLSATPSVLLDHLKAQVLPDLSDDDVLVCLDGTSSLCVRRLYAPDAFAKRLHQTMDELSADVLLASCVNCYPATAKLMAVCDRSFGKLKRNRYPSADGWAARVGAFRRLVRRHGAQSLMSERWWAEVIEVNWGNYGNQPRIVIDHDCHLFQPLDDMVLDLAPAPFSLLNSRTGAQPMFLQRTGVASLGPWMEMIWPTGPGKPWERFLGEYEKQRDDVVLDSGEMLLDLWPNAGLFVDHSAQDRTVVGERVVWLRPRT